jgi:hypothetical protein
VKKSIFQSYIRLTFDEMTADLWRITILKLPQFMGQHIVQRASNHRHDNIKVNFNKNGWGIAGTALKRFRWCPLLEI